MLSIKESAMALKLPYIKNNYVEALKEAHLKDMNHEQFLDWLLKAELDLRQSNSIITKTRNAKFPYKMILDDYERNHLSVEIRQKIKVLETLEFVENGENIILIGNPGTGKTALSIALGMKLCQLQKNVLFISVPNLLIELREAMSKNQITQYKKKFEMK